MAEKCPKVQKRGKKAEFHSIGATVRTQRENCVTRIGDLFLADPGKARGCSTITLVIYSFIQ